MITRLWFVLSAAWAGLSLIVIALGNQPFASLGWGVWLVICGPLFGGLLLKRIGRYVVKGN